MSFYGSMIKILRRLSFFLATGFMIDGVMHGFVRFDQFMISLLKVPYLVKLSSCCITDFVTNARACSQVHQKAACRTFLANFLLWIYWRIYFICASSYFIAIVWIASFLLTRLIWRNVL